MQKKLIAVAVAGALSAPALALAQASTVQIYGKMTFEYGYVDSGANRNKTDMLQTPGGSNVGFKGEERLATGLSAWFQCESSADVRGINQDGFCSRNSALGLKGGFGNAYVGRWDTPFKKILASGQVGTEDTALLGYSYVVAGNSTGTIASGGQGAQVSASRTIWKRRESTSINYDSPSFSGFKVMAAYSSANATSEVSSTTGSKPRVQSIAGQYANGPLSIGIAWERHVNFAAVGGGNTDQAWAIAGSYTFGPVKLGGGYNDYKYEMSQSTDLKKKTWNLGAEWNIGGPHNIMGAYAQADDSKGNSSTSPGTGGNGPIAAPVGPTGLAVNGTGAKFYEIAYRYDLSKRTSAKLGYVQVNNDDNARYSLGGMAQPTKGGEKQSAIVTYVSHTF